MTSPHSAGIPVCSMQQQGRCCNCSSPQQRTLASFSFAASKVAVLCFGALPCAPQGPCQMQGTEEPGQKQRVSQCSRRVQRRTIAATSRQREQRSRGHPSAPSSLPRTCVLPNYRVIPCRYPLAAFPASRRPHAVRVLQPPGRELHLEVSSNIPFPPAAHPPCCTRTPAATSAGTRQPPENLPLCGVEACAGCNCVPQAPPAHIVDLAVLHIRIYFIVTAAAAGAESHRAALAPRSRVLLGQQHQAATGVRPRAAPEHEVWQAAGT